MTDFYFFLSFQITYISMMYNTIQSVISIAPLYNLSKSANKSMRKIL